MNNNSTKTSKDKLLNELEFIRASLSDEDQQRSNEPITATPAEEERSPLLSSLTKERHDIEQQQALDVPILTFVTEAAHLGKDSISDGQNEIEFDFELDDDVLIHDDMPLTKTAKTDDEVPSHISIENTSSELDALKAAYRNENITLVSSAETSTGLSTLSSDATTAETQVKPDPGSTGEDLVHASQADSYSTSASTEEQKQPPIDDVESTSHVDITDDTASVVDQAIQDLGILAASINDNLAETTDINPEESPAEDDTGYDANAAQADSLQSSSTSTENSPKDSTDNPFLPPHIRERLGKHNEIISQFRQAERDATETLSILRDSVNKTTAASQNAEDVMALRDEHRAMAEHRDRQSQLNASPATNPSPKTAPVPEQPSAQLIDELIEELVPMIKSRLKARLKNMDIGNNSWKNGL